MQTMEELLKNLSLSPLSHDLRVIITCYQNQSPALDTSHLQIEPNSYPSEKDLYHCILNALQPKGLSHELLELMPYIDDYLEYYTMISDVAQNPS